MPDIPDMLGRDLDNAHIASSRGLFGAVDCLIEILAGLDLDESGDAKLERARKMLDDAKADMVTAEAAGIERANNWRSPEPPDATS